MKSKFRRVFYGVLAFVLSLAMFLLSYLIVLQATLFNPNYITDNMNTGSYYSDKADEIKEELVDLGNASGLNSDFFDGLVDSVMLYEDTQEYVNACYEGGEAKVDSDDFVQSLNSALDEYIAANNVTTTDSSRDYFVNKASSVYSSSLRLPLFITLSPYLAMLRNVVPWVIVGLAVLILGLVAVIIFTNEWKHRGVRFVCVAAGGAFLSSGILPVVLLLTNFAKKINLDSRAVYNLFVDCINNICFALLICSAVFLIIFAGLFFLHKKLRKTATS